MAAEAKKSGTCSEADAAQQEPPTVWEVVFRGRVKVRADRDTASEVLSAKMPGSIVCGRREGEWLRLDGEPGFMLISLPDEDLLQEREETLISVLNPTTGAELTVLRVPVTAAIAALRMRLCKLLQIPPYTLQLLVGARVLLDSDTLQSLGHPNSLDMVRLPFDEEMGAVLLQGVREGIHPAVREALNSRACPDAIGPEGLPALVLAAGAGRLDLVAELLTAGADSNLSQATTGATALLAASSRGHAGVVRLLCELRAGVDLHMQDGVTPLIAAALEGHAEIAEYLCSMGAQRDRQTDVGATALLLASGVGHLSVVEVLCQAGASLELPLQNGRTPLQEAVGQQHVEVAVRLVAAKADKDSQDHEGMTALARAAMTGQVEVVRMLCIAGANVHLAARTGATPLFLASQTGESSVIQLLLASRANLGQPLGNGATPLQRVTQSGTDEVLPHVPQPNSDHSQEQ